LIHTLRGLRKEGGNLLGEQVHVELRLETVSAENPWLKSSLPPWAFTAARTLPSEARYLVPWGPFLPSLLRSSQCSLSTRPSQLVFQKA